MESGIPPLRYVLSKRRCTFLKSKLNFNDIEQPFINFYRLCQENNTPGYRFLSRSLEYHVECNPLLNVAISVRGKAINGTKFNTYICDLNQALVTHPVYLTNIFIPDYLRESVSRVRLMSHNLKIETGRWSRRPREARVCPCNDRDIQTEKHVLLECGLTQNIRNRYPMLNFMNTNSLFESGDHILSMCKYVHEVLDVYK